MRFATETLFPLVLLCALTGSCSQGSTNARGRKNVLVICIDTLRADRLGCYGYEKHPTSPNIDALASEALVFERTTAAAGWTKPSVPSFMTGTYPVQHGVYEGSAHEADGQKSDVLPPDAMTLAESFSAAGYQTAAFIHNAHLRGGLGFEQGFERYDDTAGDARSIRWSSLDWLDTRSSDVKPFFLYLHLLDVHWPYDDLPEEYARMFASGTDISAFRGDNSRALRDKINSGARTLSDAERAGLSALYDGALRSVDEQLGALFRELKRRDLWDDTVVCVLADHGEEFLEHGKIGHGHGLWENLLAVPWILRIPGRASERIKEPVSLVDLVPTLCAAADVSSGSATEGSNRLDRRAKEIVLFSEHKDPGAYVQSYRRGPLKLLRRFTPPVSVASAGNPRERLKPGTRWEAECTFTPEGGWLATQMSLRSESAGDPIEIKAQVAHLSGTTFDLNGVSIKLADNCDIYGELAEANARGSMLVDGLGVKAVGSFQEGVFVAAKLKLYSADKPSSSEVRGNIGSVEERPDGLRLKLGGVKIDCDAGTKWELGSASAQKLTREDVMRIVELGGPGALEAGFGLEAQLYDLASDPQEQQPLKTSVEEMSRGLDEFARALLHRRAFGPAQRAALDEGAVRDLRAIGY
ncbi:MAG: sulfatase [Planctomycetota bacterium]